MAIMGLAQLGDHSDIQVLEQLLQNESDPSVISSLSKGIYISKNNQFNTEKKYSRKYMVNENGLIGDDSDKWYGDASLYNIFSEAEDPENDI